MTDKTYIALLRGINVGGKVLKMADLKRVVEVLGFEDVRTYLQSGNVVFRATEEDNGTLARQISAAICDRAGIEVTVMVRTAQEWNGIVRSNPFPQAEDFPRTVHAFVLDQIPDTTRIQALAAKEAGREEWQIVDGTLYLHTPEGFGKSILGNLVERVLKVPMTARNWNTVRALQELAGGS